VVVQRGRVSLLCINICLAVFNRHAVSIFKVGDCAQVTGR